jgi:mono/diheme cytochrome c family protein
VPKWQYGPNIILEELKREGSKLTPAPLQKNELSFYPFPSGKGLYASLNPKVYSTQTEEEVDQLFDVFPDHQHPGIDHYYIKKKYYTSYNIAHGKQFFLLNCAVCHGNEADGTGPRAEVMREAKPRVLTDLDWIKSKDDIYLLRSIKYGVPGTSMTPWGDLTNGLQRMQLVMFIRTLSEEQDRREKLIAVLYETFETALITIDQARIGYSKEIEELKRQNRALKQKQTALERSVEENLALQNYKQNLEIERQMDQFQNDDQQLLMLKEEVKREKEIFYSLGLNLLSKGVSDELFRKYIELIQLNMQAYALQNLKLVFLLPQDHEAKARELVQAMTKEMERKIASLEQEKRVISGKMASAVRSEELMNIQADLEANKKLKAKMITDIEETFRSVEKQKKMINKINRGEER